MSKFVWKKRWLPLLLPLVLLCGCSSLGTSQTSPTLTPAVNQASLAATAVAKQAPLAATAAAQVVFASYVGKWEVHGSLLSINANHTGLEQWNVGPCSDAGQMCNGNAHITFTVNADGSIKGTILSVNYSQWNGDLAPTGFQPDSADPQAGDTFQLQHSEIHLLYTTWSGGRSASLNNGNRYWCDSYAVKAGWKQCGA
ncbi:MAG TPA: hypothetical protein VFV38_05725 [Ktedonobacteraceae bacterium]|nr:hypothetical protein [Ktedonobacteraceae bacterium]